MGRNSGGTPGGAQGKDGDSTYKGSIKNVDLWLK